MKSWRPGENRLHWGFPIRATVRYTKEPEAEPRVLSHYIKEYKFLGTINCFHIGVKTLGTSVVRRTLAHKYCALGKYLRRPTDASAQILCGREVPPSSDGR